MAALPFLFMGITFCLFRDMSLHKELEPGNFTAVGRVFF
jgi:hypothetical protein